MEGVDVSNISEADAQEIYDLVTRIRNSEHLRGVAVGIGMAHIKLMNIATEYFLGEDDAEARVVREAYLDIAEFLEEATGQHIKSIAGRPLHRLLDKLCISE